MTIKRVLFSLLFLMTLTAMKGQTTDFARGADVSWCTEMEADGQKFYNSAGEERELLALMKEIGMTAIRLRVWVNPSRYGYGAWCDKADVLTKARRAHAQGLDLMIDFHYSDFFADPGTQNTPLDWAGYTLEQMKTAIADHTKDVLQALTSEGITPKWIQIGNETNNGMVWNTGKIDWSLSGSARYANYVALSNAGYDAAKSVCPDALVMMHFSDAYKASSSDCWRIKDFKEAGGKFDMVGLSHYPDYENWNSTTSGVATNAAAAYSVKTIGQKFGVPVMICETGFSSSDVATATAVMDDLFDRLKDMPQCAGIFYWEPEVDGVWKPSFYETKGWGAYGMGAFSKTGRPTSILNAFSGNSSSQTYPSSLKIYNVGGTSVLTTLLPTGEGDGIYGGQLNATEAWLNFFIVDEENSIWYGTDPSDKTTLSSASGKWNCWIDSSQTGIYDIVVNLQTKKWSHTYNAAATGINEHEARAATTPTVWYDLQGRRIDANAQGVLIMNHEGNVRKVVR